MLVVVTILAVILIAACQLNNKLCSYWKRRGFPYVPAASIFSSKLISSFLLTPPFLEDIYKKAEGQSFIAFFQMREPILMLCTPDMINHVLNKNFMNFSSTRKSECSENSDPLSQHLLALNGEQWKNIRSKLTPVFTSGKLKNMFPILDNNVNQFLDFLGKHDGVAIDVEEFCSRLSVTSILCCSFGVDTNCQNTDNDKFINVGKMAFEAGYWRLMKTRFRMMFPRLFNLLRMGGYVRGHASFCENFIREVIEHRKRTGFYRPDFVEILMKLWKNETSGEDFSDSLIIAQVYSFLVAGYETTTTTLCCALFELSHDSKAAEKLRNEALGTIETSGSLNYESINGMEFLDRIIKEALRKHPPVIFIPRVCTKETILPGTSSVIEEGTQLLIPVLALHRDPKYYAYPDEFLPQRFSRNSPKISTPDIPYLPFSEGPRKCIGMRFALLELKIALAKIVLEFDFELDPSTSKQIELEEYARTYKIKNRIKIVFHRRNHLNKNS